MEWKPASRGYAILNAPTTPFLVWGRVKASRVSSLYLDMWALIKLLIAEMRYEGDDLTSNIKRVFERREEVSGLIRVHARNKDKWFFPAHNAHLFIGFLPDGIRPTGVKYGRFMREFQKICKQELKYEGVTEYSADSDMEVAGERVIVAEEVGPSPPSVLRVSKRLREKAQRSALPPPPVATALSDAPGEATPALTPTAVSDEKVDKGKEEIDAPEEIAGYALRPKRARPEKPDIAARMNAEYGGTVYANSQEELAADAARLVNLGYHSDDDQDIFVVDDDDFPPPPPPVKEGEGGMEEEPIDDDGGYPSPMEEEGDDDYDFGIAELPDDDNDAPKPINGGGGGGGDGGGSGVSTVSLPLDAVEQRIRIDTAAIESLLLVATYVHDHHGHHRRDEDNPFAKTLDDIEGHLVQAARRIMELAPPGANRSTVSVVAVEDADGTEVRMQQMAHSLSLNWSALTSDEQRALARQVRDEHKRIYGVYPKKKRMMYGGRKSGLIYFYNQETADACMKPVLERYIQTHNAKHADTRPGYFSSSSSSSSSSLSQK